jgi:protein-disulfide isomerase
MKSFTSKKLATALVIGSILSGLSVSALAEKSTQNIWLITVAETKQGSFIMGNPDAATKVVEYASYTCGHCATFEANDTPRLKQETVVTGKVSFEIRSLVRDPIDLTLAMLARCGGEKKFFANHQFLMANQKAISGRTDAITKPTADKLGKADYAGFMLDAYNEMKLGELMQQRGISDEQAKVCLSDKKALADLIAVTDAASATYKVTGTPSFLVNDKLAENIHNYDGLKPLLMAKK